MMRVYVKAIFLPSILSSQWHFQTRMDSLVLNVSSTSSYLSRIMKTPKRFNLDFLSKEVVEGVITINSDTKKCKIDETGKKNRTESKYTAFDDHLNVRLTLHAVKFINPSGVVSATDDDDDCWVEPSKERPYIAFAMSMGHTECADKLFIAEKVNSHTHFSDELE